MRAYFGSFYGIEYLAGVTSMIVIVGLWLFAELLQDASIAARNKRVEKTRNAIGDKKSGEKIKEDAA